jgi:hypothetical protein
MLSKPESLPALFFVHDREKNNPANVNWIQESRTISPVAAFRFY